jgi:hypothetical protein
MNTTLTSTKRWLATLAIVAGCVGIASSGASAASAKAGTQIADKAERPSAEKKATQIAQFRVWASKPSKVQVTKDGSCWSLPVTGEAKNPFGAKLFRVWQTTRVCRKEGKVLYVEVSKTGQQILNSLLYEEAQPARTQITITNNKEFGHGLAHWRLQPRLAPAKDVCLLQRLGVRRGVASKSSTCNVGG